MADDAKSDLTNATTLPTSGLELALLRKRPVLIDLPILKSIISSSKFTADAAAAAAEKEKARQAQIASLVDNFNQYHAARDNLLKFKGAHIFTNAQGDAIADNAPSSLRPFDSANRRIDFLSKISESRSVFGMKSVIMKSNFG